jgi:competence protein ComEC
MTAPGRMPALFSLAGICLALWVLQQGIPLFIFPLVAMSGTLALVLLFTTQEKPGYWKGVALVVLVAGIGSAYISSRLSIDFLYPGETFQGQGYILLERPWGRRRALLIRTKKGTFLAKIPSQHGFIAGDTVEVAGTMLSLPSSGKNRSFHEDRYWKARGAVAEIVIGKVEKIESCRQFSLSGWRNMLVKRILLTQPPRTRGYLAAAWTGMKSPLLSSQHERWGTSHLLAVSGFHVSLFVSGLLLLLRSCLGRGFIISCAMWGYVLIAGAAPSALRAALMMQIALIGRCRGRPSQAVNTVSLAGMALLFWRPWWFWDLGWQLSMVAALIIAAALERGLSPVWWLSVGPAIWVTTLPLAAPIFGDVPLAGIVINLSAGPVFGVLYPLASFLALPSLLALPWGNWASQGAEGLFILWETWADSISRLIPVYVPWTPFWTAFAAGLLPLLIARSLRLSWRHSLAASLLLQCVMLWIVM